jgi:hypothetical protein
MYKNNTLILKQKEIEENIDIEKTKKPNFIKYTLKTFFIESD